MLRVRTRGGARAGKAEQAGVIAALRAEMDKASKKCAAIKLEADQSCTAATAAPGYDPASKYVVHSFGHCVIDGDCVTSDQCARGYLPAAVGGGACACLEDTAGSSLQGTHGTGTGE